MRGLPLAFAGVLAFSGAAFAQLPAADGASFAQLAAPAAAFVGTPFAARIDDDAPGFAPPPFAAAFAPPGRGAGAAAAHARPHFDHDTMPDLIVSAPTPIPEPETYAMLLAGLGLLAIVAAVGAERQKTTT